MMKKGCSFFEKNLKIPIGFLLKYGELMSPLMFVPTDHAILRMRSAEVPIEQIGSSEIQELIDQMLEIAKGERSDLQKRVMVGLAAPQLGVPKQVILVDIGGDYYSGKNLGKLQAYINPVILWRSEETEPGDECCYSADDLLAVVPRASKVRISAYDRSGHQVVEEHAGFPARIFQHEIDHLNGIRFPDRIGPEGKLLWVDDNDYESYRTNSENWPKTCPFSTWLRMRGS